MGCFEGSYNDVGVVTAPRVCTSLGARDPAAGGLPFIATLGLLIGWTKSATGSLDKPAVPAPT